MEVRDRVKELRRVPASSLRPNPKNWRRHPQAQSDVLSGLLEEVGYADALIAYEDEGGTLTLIDGHLRAGTTPDAIVPVLVLDVDESEADKILMTLDPLAAMAERDNEAALELAQSIETNDEAVLGLIESIMAESKAPAATEPDGKTRALPNMIVKYEIIFDNEDQQTRFYTWLRHLKTRSPGETIAERIDNYIESLGWDDE